MVVLNVGGVADGLSRRSSKGRSAALLGGTPNCSLSQVWLVSKTLAGPQNVMDANASSAASTVVKPITGNNHPHSSQASQRSTMRLRATRTPRRAEVAKAAARSASLVSTLLDSSFWSTLKGCVKNRAMGQMGQWML